MKLLKLFEGNIRMEQVGLAMDGIKLDETDLKMEDFVDVVYKCKFCPYTCTHSSDMGRHVRENHLPSPDMGRHVRENHLPSPDMGPHVRENHLPSPASSSLVTHVVASDPKTASDSGPSETRASETLARTEHFPNKPLGADLGRNMESKAFLDRSLTPVPIAPFAKAVSTVEPTPLSNTSSPDLTELISLVKPSATTQAVKTPVGQFSVHVMDPSGLAVHEPVETPETPIPPEIELSDPASIYNTALLSEATQPYTVMAIQMPNLSVSDSTSLPQYIVSTQGPEPATFPDTTETKEFLLCGLCKLAFTSMEECQTHMQLEHRELMQDTGVSIGVQVGGAKRGRKRKSEQLKRIKTEPEPEPAEPEDVEWLPEFSPGSHSDGRSRRRVKPPRALKEDYVFGQRVAPSNKKGPGSDAQYKLRCSMMGCKARLKTEEGLRIHMECHNMDDTALTCKVCEAPHNYWKNLRIHLWQKHKIDCDLFTCHQCGYKTDTRHKMNIHMEIHSESKPYTCDVCGKGFRQASQMKNHQVTHVKSTTKEVGQYWFTAKKCDVCDRVFANSKCLKKHVEVVHGNNKPYKCGYCSHTTARKAMMQLHMRTHTKEKPFKCDICDYSTGDHNSLRRHKMRHTGQKQYRCTLCPYTCIQSISLKQHMRHKHPGTSEGIFQCSRCPFRTINQTIYFAHVQDHKKGLIPDKLVHPRVELPKARKAPVKNQSSRPVVSSLLLKHPQLHTVLPGEGFASVGGMTGSQAVGGIVGDSSHSQAEVFNMQVSMLSSGDTQISADDITRLSECPGVARAGTTALQLIYDTLATLSGHTTAGRGHPTLLTTQLSSGVHTAVLSSQQDGLTVHNITYHLPKCEAPVVSTSQANKSDEEASVKKLVSDVDSSTCTKEEGGEERGSQERCSVEWQQSQPNPDSTSSQVTQVLGQEGCSQRRSVEGERTGVSGSLDVNALKEVVTVIDENNEVSFISVDPVPS